MDNNVGAMFDRTAEVRRGEGVVDDERELVLMGDGSNLLNVEDVAAGVRDGFSVETLGLRRDGPAEVLGVIGFDERDTDTHAPEGDVELRVSSTIEGGGGDDMVPGLTDIGDRQELRRLSGGDGEGGHAPFQRGDSFFEHRRGGVHDARIDVAELLQGEELRGIVGVVEDEGGRLVDGNSARFGGGVDGVALVKGAGIEALRALGFCHGEGQFIEVGVGRSVLAAQAPPQIILCPCRNARCRFGPQLGQLGDNKVLVN